MCESKVFLAKKDGKEKIMDSAINVREEGGKVVVLGLMGERRELQGARIVEINIDKHEVLLAEEEERP
jgi:predicted RNA-binding protein